MYGYPVIITTYYPIKNYHDLFYSERELGLDLMIKVLNRFKSMSSYTANQKPRLLQPICEKHATILTVKIRKEKDKPRKCKVILLYCSLIFSGKMNYQV